MRRGREAYEGESDDGFETGCHGGGLELLMGGCDSFGGVFEGLVRLKPSHTCNISGKSMQRQLRLDLMEVGRSTRSVEHA
jgi:hypothetical protein